MAFTDIYYIYGIQLDIKMMIQFFGKEIAEALLKAYRAYGDEQWLKAETQEDTEESHEPSEFTRQLRELTIVKDEDCLYDLFMGEFLEDMPDIFQYPCCSKEMERTWILGVRIPKMGLQSLFDKSMGLRKIGNLDFPGGDQVKADWKKLVVKYELQGPPKEETNGESSTEKTSIAEPDVYQIFNDCLSCT